MASTVAMAARPAGGVKVATVEPGLPESTVATVVTAATADCCTATPEQVGQGPKPSPGPVAAVAAPPDWSAAGATAVSVESPSVTTGAALAEPAVRVDGFGA